MAAIPKKYYLQSDYYRNMVYGCHSKKILFTKCLQFIPRPYNNLAAKMAYNSNNRQVQYSGELSGIQMVLSSLIRSGIQMPFE